MSLTIRELSGIDDMRAAEDIQARVWGADAGIHPKEILIPIQLEGGLLAGSFDPDAGMVGMVFGFPTRDHAVQHSQMLATLPGWRGRGIGARLKWFQRDWCLERGIRRVRWTVDPLRAANAALNIRRLGGTASTYYTDFYGPMLGIDAGAPSDRLLVEWDLLSPRVIDRAAAWADVSSAAPSAEPSPDAASAEAVPVLRAAGGRPVDPLFNLTCPSIRLDLPADFTALARSDPALALEWRMQTRALFLHYFAGGWAVTGFTRAGGPAYLLEKHVVSQ